MYLRAIFQVQHPGGLYLEGRFNGGFYALPVWGLIHGGAYFRNFTVFNRFQHDYNAKIRLGKKIHLNKSQKRDTLQTEAPN